MPSVITPRLQRYAPIPNDTALPMAKVRTVIDQSTVPATNARRRAKSQAR